MATLDSDSDHYRQVLLYLSFPPKMVLTDIPELCLGLPKLNSKDMQRGYTPGIFLTISLKGVVSLPFSRLKLYLRALAHRGVLRMTRAQSLQMCNGEKCG